MDKLASFAVVVGWGAIVVGLIVVIWANYRRNSDDN